ncbi:MAG: RNA-binding S4 domain-containing protein [Parvibaculum sp.]|uniref:RNA-binding S4 domain-containing protein n=1 Tax=Parvibaculum sp. TaxID=2024848 RepID=UPI003C722356
MSGSVEPVSGQRIDRWLWFARFLKSRTLAAALVASGKMRVNGERVVKASRLVRPGDVLTFPLGPHIRVIEVVASGTRRGPAAEARGLYADLAPPAPPAATETSIAAREPGSGRPTKKDRRRTDALKDGS